MVATHLVAKILILDKSSNLLVLKRGDNHPRFAGFYDLPGGGVEHGEEPGEAIVREVQEETGIQLSHQDIQVLYATTMFLRERSWPTLLYVARLHENTPAVQLSYEHKAFEWAPLDRLAEVEPQIAPTYREALDYIRTNGILDDIVIV
jgi:8-oxo-dGTP diphosphatase